MILKHTAYILRLDETVGFNKSTNKEGEPVITFWTEGKICDFSERPGVL